MRTNKDIDFAFNSVPVNQLTESQKHRAMKLSKRFQEMAEETLDLLGPGPECASILRELLKVKFQCVQAITHEVKTTVATMTPADKGTNGPAPAIDQNVNPPRPQ